MISAKSCMYEHVWWKQEVVLVQSADQQDLFQYHLPILREKKNKSDRGLFE